MPLGKKDREEEQVSEVFPHYYYDTRFHLEGAPDPLPHAFAIIAAHNPMNRIRSLRINRKDDLRLRRLLERKLHPHFRAIAQATDGSHIEPGWAVEAPVEEALAIARRYKQFAIWWIESGELHLIHSTGEPRSHVGAFSGHLI